MAVYCIPRLEQLEVFCEYSSLYGVAFEYNEFFIPQILMDEEKKKEIIGIYKSLDRDRSRDTLHGAFLDIVVNSGDPEIYEISKKRVYQCMDIAKELGIKAVIFHTNYITNFKSSGYRQYWIERNEEFWRETLKEYPDLMIYLENMFDESPELLAKLAERMKDEERFGVCLDFAHAFISGTPIDEWVDKLKPYIKHVHVNDNDGYEDCHFPVGQGKFPWECFKGWIASMDNNPSILIEVKGAEEFKESAIYMQEQGFFDK